MRGSYLAAAVLFVAFAVWGSLFPFDVRPLPAADALSLFWSAWGTGPASWSRSDFASNVLLFIPIGLFSCATIDQSGARGRRLAAPVTVLVFAVLLSSFLEIAQSVVPSRTSSAVDVLAEAIGAVAGVLIWRLGWKRIDASLQWAETIVGGAPYLDRLMLAYSALFAVAWLAPFDFTLRPNEIADKFEHKRLLLPFAPSPDAVSPMMLTITCLASIPIGMVAMRLGAPTRRPIASVMRVMLPALLMLEVAQVLVFSRTTDATALVAAIGGVLAGAVIARLGRSETATPLRSGTTG